MRENPDDLAVHIVIPDTQVKPGVPLDHLSWIGRYIVDAFRDHPRLRVIHLGDHADMESLSSYDKGKKEMEGRRYRRDIEAANYGFDLLNAALIEENERRRRNKERLWLPDRHILLGNHEDRITRAVSSDAALEGTIGTDDLNYAQHGWIVHDYLEVVVLEGVAYSHYFYNAMNGRPYTGMIETRIKQVGQSFTQGHQQTLMYGLHWGLSERARHGLVAGSCYLHDEDYKGPQGNRHWRGIIVCHQVEEGSYSPMFVDLDYLCRRYQGVRLSRFTPREFYPDGD